MAILDTKKPYQVSEVIDMTLRAIDPVIIPSNTLISIEGIIFRDWWTDGVNLYATNGRVRVNEEPAWEHAEIWFYVMDKAKK